MLKKIEVKNIILSLLGSAILAFGMYNVHAQANVTEGGLLGLTLLLHHWFNISPSVSSFIMNAICYLIGFRILGKMFLFYSVFACGGFSLFYAICEQLDPIYPQIASYPLLAAIVGAVFVGVGVGICVLAGSAPTGDDAVAMSLSTKFKIAIQ